MTNDPLALHARARYKEITRILYNIDYKYLPRHGINLTNKVDFVDFNSQYNAPSLTALISGLHFLPKKNPPLDIRYGIVPRE